MYCDHCGTQIGESQNFCPSCGHRLGGIPAGPQPGRMAGHFRLLGILWLALSAFRLLPSVFLLGFGRIGFHVPDMPRFVLTLLGVIGVAILISALAGFLAGWGLLARASWARPLALVLGALGLVDPPFGTALGVYTLWVLLSEGAAEEYGRASRTAS